MKSLGPELERAQIASAVMAWLGSEREADAEYLADQICALLAAVRDAGGGILMPSAPSPELNPVLLELRDQMKAHSEQVVEAACGAIGTTLMLALKVALRGAPPHG